jgi:putative FmdB family regulatory protein
MPTYDYRCESCGHTFDAFQKMSDPVLVECPECGEPKLRRLIGSGAGIIFKGSGFYETDYKRSKSDAGKKEEKKSESKSESKPDKKSEGST